MSDEPASSKTQSQMVSRDTRKRHQEGLYTVKTFKYFRESKYFLIFLAGTLLDFSMVKYQGIKLEF